MAPLYLNGSIGVFGISNEDITECSWQIQTTNMTTVQCEHRIITL